MNIKGVSVVIGVGLVILSVVFLSNNSEVLPPQIIDETIVKDSSVVDIDSETGDIQIKDNVTMESSAQDVPTILDSVVTEQSNDIDFYFDENGTKHYIITARDAPLLGK
jgi:hypothetical protein